MTPIFISYRRSDAADVAGRIRDRLREQWGEGVAFLDVESIPLGVDFREHLARQLKGCRAFLVIIGKEWLMARNPQGQLRLKDPEDVVRLEVETALARGIPVIPLLVQGASMPRLDQLPDSLRALADRNGTLIRPDPDFQHDMERLMQALAPSVGQDHEAPPPAIEGHIVAPKTRTSSLKTLWSSTLVRWMTLLLAIVALTQVATFVSTDSDELRTASVVAGSLVGIPLVFAGTKRRQHIEVLLGAVGACAPWLLRLILDPFGAIMCAAAVQLFLSAVVLRQLPRRQHTSPRYDI